ncbi:Contactin-4 [Lamellibrachia satsuma]|nr:Contactin-4 [Lamellibrachia satsuma]
MDLCSLDGQAHFIVYNELPAEPRRTVTKTSVIYHNLTKTDAQVLQCNATNKHGYIFTNAFLNVLAEPPSFIEAPKPVVRAAEVQDISLKCRTFGAPKPVITWTKDGEAITDNRFKVKKNGDLKIKLVTSSDTKGVALPTLLPDANPHSNVSNDVLFQGVLHSDFGTYKCLARNKFGEISAVGELLVRDQTVILQGPMRQEVNATANVVFNCQASTDPAEESKL